MKKAEQNPKIAELLDNTRWADDMAWTEIKVLSRYIHLHRFPVGSTIFKEGAIERSMGILVEGKVDIIKSNGLGARRKKLATLNPSQTFGEMSLVDNEPRSASAIAAGAVVVLFMTQADFDRLVEEQPELACKVIKRIAGMMSRRLRMASGRLLEYAADG